MRSVPRGPLPLVDFLPTLALCGDGGGGSSPPGTATIASDTVIGELPGPWAYGPYAP